MIIRGVNYTGPWYHSHTHTDTKNRHMQHAKAYTRHPYTENSPNERPEPDAARRIYARGQGSVVASDGDRALRAEQRVVVARHPLVAHHLTNGAWSAEEGAAEVLACARARHTGQDRDCVLNKGRKPRERHSRGAGRSPRASQGAAGRGGASTAQCGSGKRRVCAGRTPVWESTHRL